MNLLTVKNLKKSFKGLHVLNDISLEVKDGERHVIIGPNGAGKTTFFNCITGFLPINAGTVALRETPITNAAPHAMIHLGMSRTFQKNKLFWDLTVEENIYLALTSLKPYKFQLFKPLTKYGDILAETHELLTKWKLWDRREILVKELSYGEQRLLEILMASAPNPQLLLLDEPTSGMSPAETKQTIGLIQSLPRTTALLVIEHDMEVVFSIADRITVLHHGEVVLSGLPEEVRGHERVKEIYFGGGTKAHA